MKRRREFKTEWKGEIEGGDVNRVLMYEILKKKKDLIKIFFIKKILSKPMLSQNTQSR